MKISRRLINTLFVCTLLLATALGGLAFYTTNELGRSSEWVTHTYRIISGLQTINGKLNGMVFIHRQTTGGRTESPYDQQSLIRNLRIDISSLRSQVADNPAQVANLDRLERHLWEYSRRASDPSADTEIRQAIAVTAGMSHLEKDLLLIRKEALRQSERNSKLISVIATLSLVGLFIFIFVLLRRENEEHLSTQNFLEDSRKFIERITQSTPNIIFVYDLTENRTIYVNHDIYEVLGYGIDDHPQSYDFRDSFVHADDMSRIAEQDARIAECTDNDEIFELEYRVRHANGEWHWLRTKTVIFKRDRSGRVVQVMGQAEDITEQRHALDELRESKHFIERVADAIPEILYVYDISEKKNIYLNRDIGELLGYNGSELEDSGITLSDIIEPGKNSSRTRISSDQAGEMFETEYRVRTRDNRFRWIYARDIVFKRSEKGAPEQILGTLQDITERKIVQEELENTTAQLQAVFSSATAVSMIATNADGVITVFNSGAEQMLGYSAAEIIGKHTPALFHMASEIVGYAHQIKEKYNYEISDAVEVFTYPARHQENTVYECSYVRKDGSRLTVNLAISAMRDSTGEVIGFLGIATDISRSKEAVAELRKAKDAAEDATRAKSEFLANMSHEIRTPMNAILGFAELLKENLAEKKLSDYAQAIYSSGKNLLSLINDILDLSKIESGHMELQLEETSLVQIITEIKDIFRMAAQDKSVELVADIDPAIPQKIMLDETRMRQILFNLAGNAVKFTQDGFVKISVQLQATHPDQTADLIISVEDTGIGIAEDQLELIFEAFRQSSGQNTRKYGGTGLGLTITKRLVEMMGGVISVESDLGKGSIFQILMSNVKFAESSDEPLAAEQRRNGLPVFGPGTILIVDDIPLNRELVKGFLLDTPLTVIEATNGKEGVELAMQYRPDLIFMDMKMPVMDGYAATELIKSDPELQHTPVIALTASVMRENEGRIFDVGCDSILRKPVLKSDLLEEMAKFIAHNNRHERAELSNGAGNEEAPEVAGILLSDEEKAAVEEALLSLENGLQDHYENVKKTFLIDEIERFGREIYALGKRLNLGMLEQYGATLVNYAQSFEIDRLAYSLDQYPKLLENLRNLLLS